MPRRLDPVDVAGAADHADGGQGGVHRRRRLASRQDRHHHNPHGPGRLLRRLPQLLRPGSDPAARLRRRRRRRRVRRYGPTTLLNSDPLHAPRTRAFPRSLF
uniref:Uncharacterized protein n=1 Tax=Triticum urartu TaxID=4572 RepID=A0A8R7UFX4_TRIUA